MDAPTTLRADAQRNREKLLIAAQQEFGRSGDAASLEAIARSAGVGIGTLYRHFPTRDALILGAYRRDVEQLCDYAAELEQTEPPDRALRSWLERVARWTISKQEMADALTAAAKLGGHAPSEQYLALIAALAGLLARGVDAGVIRDDICADDLMLAITGLWHTDATDDAQAQRLLNLLMDGLQAGRRPAPRRRASHPR